MGSHECCIDMKKILCKIGICAIWLVVAGGVVTGKDWRGIVPLKSTRIDVERAFGVPKHSTSQFSYYNLANEIAVFRFEAESCDPYGLRWNVPMGTVVRIGVVPKGTHRREEYQSSDLKMVFNGAGFSDYSDYSAGLTIETYKNLVTLVDYYPEAAQDNLRCPQIQECCIDFFPKFDEYERLTFADEKARLDNFVIHMNNVFGRGIIEVLGPSRRDRQQLMKLAVRAKRYLVKERGLEAERLLLVDGGFKGTALTRLSIYSIGGLASGIRLFPEEDPETRPSASEKIKRPHHRYVGQ